MNNVRELRLQRGIQQKELAIAIGVTSATVSDWEHGRKNPSGERLRKLADFFGVEPAVILGTNDRVIEVSPEQQAKISETEQIVNHILEKLGTQPKTKEARILAEGIDMMPKEKREYALRLFLAAFDEYADVFKKGMDDDT